MIGKITTWNLERGFGFIKSGGLGADVFVHCSSLADRSLDHLPVGTRVSFDVEPHERSGKQRAVKVAIIDADVAQAPRRPSPRDVAEQIFTHPGRI